MAVIQQLAQLEAAQLVRRAEDVDPSYQFKHALTQDRAYASLLKSQRIELHRRTALAYEQLYSQQLDEFAALLAHHFAEAGEDAKTIEYATRAGAAAMRVFANTEAVAFYSQAVQVAKRAAAAGSTSLRDLYLTLGRAYELCNNYDAALRTYEEMAALARERGDQPMELGSLMARGIIHSIPSVHFNTAKAQAMLDQAMRLAQQLGDRPAEAKVLWTLMLWYSHTGVTYDQALDCGERSLAIARELNLQEQLAYTLNDICQLYVFNGQLEQGKAANQEARQMWQAMNNLPMLADDLGYETMTHALAAEYPEAIASSRAHLELSQKIGSRWGEAFSQTWVGPAYVELGLIEGAIAAMESAVRAGENVFTPPLAITRAELAWLLGELGDLARGIQLARLAQTVSKEAFPTMLLATSGILCRLLIQSGDIDAAKAVLDEASTHPDFETVMPLFDASIALAVAELALARGDFARAVSLSDAFIAKRRRLKLPARLPAALLINARAHLAQSDLDSAARALTAARQLAEAQSARWMLWRILAATSQVEARRGNAAHARNLLAQAREPLAYVVAHTPQEFRASFLNLPNVREVLQAQ